MDNILSIMYAALETALRNGRYNEAKLIQDGCARLHWMDELASMPTAEMPAVTLCAWCLKSQGIEPRAEDSHGICAEHAAQVAEQSRARRAARLARVA